MLKYEGLFFDNATEDYIHSLEENKLECVNDKIHCTFKYKPTNEEIFNDIVGHKFVIELIGYGNDGKNSGFSVKLPNKLKKYYLAKDVIPHITASISNNAKAINTRYLKFKKFEKPYKITGTFGYWIVDDDENEYLSFNKYTY